MRIKEYFYSVGETAQLLGVNRITVWRWLKSGKVDGEAVGNLHLIPKWQVHLLKDNDNKSFKPNDNKSFKPNPPTLADIDEAQRQFLVRIGR